MAIIRCFSSHTGQLEDALAGSSFENFNSYFSICGQWVRAARKHKAFANTNSLLSMVRGGKLHSGSRYDET